MALIWYMVLVNGLRRKAKISSANFKVPSRYGVWMNNNGNGRDGLVSRQLQHLLVAVVPRPMAFDTRTGRGSMMGHG
jgi:hypothetical protein